MKTRNEKIKWIPIYIPRSSKSSVNISKPSKIYKRLYFKASISQYGFKANPPPSINEVYSILPSSNIKKVKGIESRYYLFIIKRPKWSHISMRSPKGYHFMNLGICIYRLIQCLISKVRFFNFSLLLKELASSFEMSPFIIDIWDSRKQVTSILINYCIISWLYNIVLIY